MVWDKVTPMQTTSNPTPEVHESTRWRRAVRDGYRPSPALPGTITRAYENNDYTALLQAIKSKSVYVDGHWRWSGWIFPDGSPKVMLRARSVRVRRLVAEAYIGGRLNSVDKIFGTCSHTDCVNPEHLEIRIFKR